MKNLFYSLFLSFLFFASFNGFSQCTPVDCLSSLPPYGGICQTSLDTGRVNVPYYDAVSFHVTNACIDAGTLDPQYAGYGAKVVKLHSISFSGFPAGITGTTNALEYIATANTNGCGSISGTPTEVGVFNDSIHILANIQVWLFSTTCSGIIPPVSYNDQPFDGSFPLVILPDPSFTGLDSTYCFDDPASTLTPTGTAGGVFSGPGVFGNTFNPSLAGTGAHDIKYVVSAQEGDAVAPATDSSVFTVVVTPGDNYYADTDSDGFGNTDSTITACSQPAGFVVNNMDCNDSSAVINPNTVWYADLDGDEYVSTHDSVIACIEPSANYILLSSSLGIDCNDTNANISPGAAEIPYNGIDENCDGVDTISAGIFEINSGKFRIYPNPVLERIIYVETIGFKPNNEFYLEINNVFGQLVLKQQLFEMKNIIDLTGINGNGLYLLTIIDRKSNSIITRKIILQ